VDPTIETLMDACGRLGIRPTKAFASVQDFEAYVLGLYRTEGIALERQLSWALQAVQAAQERKVPAAVQCIKNVKHEASS